MARRKVRHAIVQYLIEVNGRQRFETAFRGMVVDIPEDQVERLDSLGATVAEEQELARAGSMLTLPETAGDAEIMSWVMGATNDEVKNLVQQNPVMAPRIEAAFASVQQRFEEQNLHLGGLRKVAQEAAEEQEKVGATTTTDNSGGTSPAPQSSDTTEPAVNDPGEAARAEDDAVPPEEPEESSEEDADKVVRSNADTVKKYIAENPHRANAILEAEERRAQGKGEDVRSSVVRAAQAAAGFSQ
jgi:hypothetical protein